MSLPSTAAAWRSHGVLAAALRDRAAHRGHGGQRNGPELQHRTIRRTRSSFRCARLGWCRTDALQLGIRTARFGACVDAHGRASERLYYLGPMLRADHLDATAAAELTAITRSSSPRISPSAACGARSACAIPASSRCKIFPRAVHRHAGSQQAAAIAQAQHLHGARRVEVSVPNANAFLSQAPWPLAPRSPCPG